MGDSNDEAFVKGLAEAALGKKASRLVLQDVTGVSDICNYQLICSGSNPKQNQAICDAVEFYAKSKHGSLPTAVEGAQTGSWILIDYGSVVVHIFDQSIRDFYALEHLWPKAVAVKV